MKLFTKIVWLVVMATIGVGAGDCLAAMLFSSELGGKVHRSNLDGSGLQTIVNSPGYDFRAIAPDEVNGRLYLADITGRIMRVNPDGSGLTTVISGLSGPNDIAIDPLGGKIYWVELGIGQIRRANLNGTGVQTLVSGQLPWYAAGIDLDLSAGKIYWSWTSYSSPSINRANLDGTAIQQLFTWQVSHSLTLDEADGKWYGSDSYGIRSGNMDGTGFISTPLLAPSGDGIDDLFSDDLNNKLYYTVQTSSFSGVVRRVNVNGTSDQFLYATALPATGIAVLNNTDFVSESVPEPSTVALLGLGGLLVLGRRSRQA